MQNVGNSEHVRSTSVRTDRILPETRWISAIIVPFLVVAFGILYLFPDSTQELFAWGIQPRMSAMMLAAAYIGYWWHLDRNITTSPGARDPLGTFHWSAHPVFRL